MDVLTTVGAVSRGLGIAKSLFAKARGEGKSFQVGQQQSVGETLIAKRDQDGDGKLSMSELGLSETIFKRIDADGDGFLSIGEMNAEAQRSAEAIRSQQGLAAYMALHDSNSDSRISLMESGLEGTTFDALDSNSDSALVKQELAVAFSGGGLDVTT
jgi:hypothetical protein